MWLDNYSQIETQKDNIDNNLDNLDIAVSQLSTENVEIWKDYWLDYTSKWMENLPAWLEIKTALNIIKNLCEYKINWEDIKPENIMFYWTLTNNTDINTVKVKIKWYNWLKIEYDNNWNIQSITNSISKKWILIYNITINKDKKTIETELDQTKTKNNLTNNLTNLNWKYDITGINTDKITIKFSNNDAIKKIWTNNDKDFEEEISINLSDWSFFWNWTSEYYTIQWDKSCQMKQWYSLPWNTDRITYYCKIDDNWNLKIYNNIRKIDNNWSKFIDTEIDNFISWIEEFDELIQKSWFKTTFNWWFKPHKTARENWRLVVNNKDNNDYNMSYVAKIQNQQWFYDNLKVPIKLHKTSQNTYTYLFNNTNTITLNWQNTNKKWPNNNNKDVKTCVTCIDNAVYINWIFYKVTWPKTVTNKPQVSPNFTLTELPQTTLSYMDTKTWNFLKTNKIIEWSFDMQQWNFKANINTSLDVDFWDFKKIPDTCNDNCDNINYSRTIKIAGTEIWKVYFDMQWNFIKLTKQWGNNSEQEIIPWLDDKLEIEIFNQTLKITPELETTNWIKWLKLSTSNDWNLKDKISKDKYTILKTLSTIQWNFSKDNINYPDTSACNIDQTSWNIKKNNNINSIKWPFLNWIYSRDIITDWQNKKTLYFKIDNWTVKLTDNEWKDLNSDSFIWETWNIYKITIDNDNIKLQAYQKTQKIIDKLLTMWKWFSIEWININWIENQNLKKYWDIYKYIDSDWNKLFEFKMNQDKEITKNNNNDDNNYFDICPAKLDFLTYTDIFCTSPDQKNLWISENTFKETRENYFNENDRNIIKVKEKNNWHFYYEYYTVKYLKSSNTFKFEKIDTENYKLEIQQKVSNLSNISNINFDRNSQISWINIILPNENEKNNYIENWWPIPIKLTSWNDNNITWNDNNITLNIIKTNKAWKLDWGKEEVTISNTKYSVKIWWTESSPTIILEIKDKANQDDF